MTLKHARTLAALGVAASLALAACTGGGGASDTPLPTTSAPQQSTSAEGSATGSAKPTIPAPPSPSRVGATTPVPQPSAGNVTSKASSKPVQTLKPVPVKSPAEVVKGVKVSLTVSAADIKAELPGDVSGPGLKVVVTVVNSSAKAIDTSLLSVTASDAKGRSAVPFYGPPSVRLAQNIPASGKAVGTYYLSLPKDGRSKIQVLVNVAPTLPTAVFQGAVS